MFVGLFKFLLFIFVVYVAYLFVRIYRAAAQIKKPRNRPAQVQGVMVRDAVCNTYVPKEEALCEVRDGVEHYFCSEECRRKFLKR